MKLFSYRDNVWQFPFPHGAGRTNGRVAEKFGQSIRLLGIYGGVREASVTLC